MRPGEFSPNNFVFNRRELKYMNGWINLLHAMEYVINDCKKTMNRWQDERAEAFTSLMIKLDQFEHKEEINNEPDKKDAGKGPARIQRSVRSRKK